MKFSLALVILLLSGLVTKAQDCAVIKGQVVDAITGDPLPGASLRVGMAGTGQLASAEGTFSFPSAKGDTLRATFVGYAPVSLVVDQCEIKVLLKPVATAIDEVVIEAEKPIAEEFAIRRLNRLDIYTNPSAKADPILAVNSMPFATTTDESANISLRGGSPAETGIFLNDVPIEDAVRYSQLNGIGTFSIFNTALISDVQVYPGNPPLEFGNSTSGVISLYSDETIPGRKTTQLSATLASLGGYHVRRLSERSSLTLFSNFQSSLLFNYVNARALRNLKSFFSADAGVHYFARLTPTLSLKVFNYSLLEAYRYNYAHPTLADIFRQDRMRNFTVINLRKQLRRMSLALNQGLSFSTAQYDFSTLNIDVPSRDYYAALNLYRTAPQYQWKTGIVYEYKDTGTRGMYPTYPFAYGAQYGAVSVNNHASQGLLEWFGYYKRYLGDATTLGGGIRKNLPRDGVDYLSWQVNANVRPVRNLNFNLSAGDFNKYVLQREKKTTGYLLNCRQYSLDLNFRKRKFDFTTSLFHKRINRGARREKVYGVEVYGRYKFDESWRAQLSLTSLRAHDDRGIGTPYNIGYFVRGNVAYKLQGVWTFTLVFLFRQGSYYYPVNTTIFHEESELYEPVYGNNPSRLPAYSTIDLSASRIFMLNARTTAIAFFNIGNLVNFRNVRGYDYNVDYTTRNDQLFSQRVVYFGIVFSF